MGLAQGQRLQANEIAVCLAKGSDERLWDDARRSFAEKNRPKKESGSEAEAFAVFIGKSESVGEMRRLCADVQKTADQKYTTSDLKIKGKTILPGTWLKQTINAMDMFIKVGDVAFKGGAESVSLGWTAVKWVLQAVKADADKCAQWAEASEMISRILLTCRTIGKMYSSAGNTEPTEMVQQLLKDIPNVYESILSYSWAARKQVERSAARRMLSEVNPLSSAANASKAAFDSIKSYYQQIREQGQDAFHEYANKALQSIDQGQKEVLLTLRESFDASQKQIQAFSESNREILDEVKKLKPLTPHQAEIQKFEQYKVKLDPSEHSSRRKKLKLQDRQPGTCTWIFDDEQYRSWRNADDSRMLRIVGGSGKGKSVVTSTVIERLISEAKQDEHMVVAYWYCYSGSTDGTQKAARLVQDVIFRLYEHATRHEDTLADMNRVFKKNDEKDKTSSNKGAVGGPDSRRVRKTVDFLGNPDETFVSLARILDHEVFVVIDALDECADRREEELFDTLHTWVRDSGLKVKIFVSSRPETDIMTGLAQYPAIDLAEKNQADLARCTDSTLARFPTLTPHEKSRIRETMLERAEGQFTYIELAIKILNQPWRRPIDDLIAKFQEGVDRLYQENLRSTDPNYKDLAHQALTWTLLQQGDLFVWDFFDIFSRRYTVEDSGIDTAEAKVEELPEPANVHENASVEEKVAEPSENPATDEESIAPFQYGKKSEVNISLYQTQIENAARTFIRVSAKDTLQEQHQNVRECFLRDDKVGDKTGDYYIDREQAHLAITLELVRTLNSDAFAREYMPLSSDGESADTAPLSDGPSTSDPWLVWNFKDAVEGDSAEEAQNDNKDEQTPGAESDSSANAVDTNSQSSANAESSATSQTSVDNGAGDPEASTSEDQKEDKVQGETQTEATETEESSQPEPDLYENDSDLDDTEETGAVAEAVETFESKGLVKRYEIWNWFRHLKCAEQAAGSDNPKKGGLWEEVWVELRKFLLSKSRFRAWCTAYMETQGDDYGQWTINSAGDPSYKFTPYHILAGLGLMWPLQRILEEGADINVENAFKDLPAICMSLDPTLNEDLDLLELLLTHCDINARDPVEQGPDYTLNYTLWSDPSEAFIRKMVEMGARVDVRGYNNRTCLHYVANVSTRPEVARYFIQKGLDINALDEDGSSPLHLLLQRPDFPEEMLEVFLENGANVRQESKASEQPLVGAAMSGQLKAVQLLLKEGPGRITADVHDEDEYGKTALHVAAGEGQHEIVDCLLQAGADINHKSHKQTTPLYLATIPKQSETALLILNRLLEHNCPLEEIDQARYNGKTVLRQAAMSNSLETVKALLQIPGMTDRINLCDDTHKRTPLHVASLMGHEKVVEVLLEKGAEVMNDKKGKTPLQLCCERWTSNSDQKCRENIALMLLDKHPDSAMTEPIALFTGAAMGSYALVQRLLELDANPNVVDDHGWKPVHVARLNNHMRNVQLLEHGGIFGLAPSSMVLPPNQSHITYDEDEDLYKCAKLEAFEHHSLIADHPIRVGETRFYYEVEIQDQPNPDARREDAWVGVGLTPKPRTANNWFPGWAQLGVGRSYGFHGDDGRLFSAPEPDRKLAGFEPYAFNDTIGCGLDAQKGEIFYTRNGKWLGTPFTKVSGRLFPVIGLHGESHLRVNFKGPFAYAPMNAPRRAGTMSPMPELGESKMRREMTRQQSLNSKMEPVAVEATPEDVIQSVEAEVKKEVGEEGDRDKLKIGMKFEVAT
ncbi:MAG: hypothetical protein Q9159_006670 [Coniocarpon cinnabarinum]